AARGAPAALRYRNSTDGDTYMQRTEAKTAMLLAACCEIGSLLAGLAGQERAALSAYGRSLGLAFQIADDVLDYTGAEGEVGKPIGHDSAEGFATLPWMLSSFNLEAEGSLDQPEAGAFVDRVRSAV